jgi:Zn-dependent M28 family amino/carboxypeptidase
MRKDIAKLVAPWMRGKPLPKSFTAAPADPFAAVDLRGIAEALVDANDALPGPKFDSRMARLRTKLTRLTEAGAVAAIVVEGPRSFADAKARAADALPTLASSRPGVEPAAMPIVQMRWHDADTFFRIGKRKLSAVQADIDRKLAPRSAVLTGTTATVTVALKATSVAVPNVIAQIEGGDRKDEIVVIGAHFDHLGRDGTGQCHTESGDAEKDGVCNGADDNASGSAMVVEVARALAAAGVKPRRTLVFANFSGEEVGLHGSKALAESPPAVPPFTNGKVVAMVNLDMVGRLDERGLAIGGVGSSPGWMPLLDAVGPHGLGVLYERAITTRSDHASFYRKNVPVLFFFTHLHPDYHRPGDESAGINKDGMTKIAELVADLVHRLGDGAELPFALPKNADEGLVGALPGTNPATIEKRVGLPEPKMVPKTESPASATP